MKRWSGKVGYSVTEEVYPSVWEDRMVEHKYTGNIVRNRMGVQQTSTINGDINMSLNISIIADAFAFENMYSIKYIEYMKHKWKVTGIEVARPRLILTIGGAYDGQGTN